MTLTHKPFEQLKKEKAPRKDRAHIWEKPVYLEKLCTVLDSQTKAADYIGITTSTISKDLKDGKTRRVNELSAKAIYMDMFGDNPEKSESGIAFIRADRKDLATIKRFVEGIGGKFTFFGDE